MSTKEELKKSFNVFVDQENNIISIVFIDEAKNIDDNVLQTKLVEERLTRALKEHRDKKFRVLVDIFDLGKGSGDISIPETRQAYQRMAEQKQIEKIAVVLSENTVLEVMANMVVKAIGKDRNFKIFHNRQEAMVWIRK